MFGIFRFVLAIFVVISHILKLNGLSFIGGFAVYGFFILSGYLMTLVMNQRYGFTPEGVKKFLINRFLRIYPTYWVAIIFSLVVLIFYQPSELTKYYSVPAILSNIFIFGLAKGGFFPLTDAMLSGPAWTLEIELIFYIAIALGLGKKKYAIPWLLFSFASIFLARIGCAIASKITNQPYGFSYGSLLYASLAFVAGALIFHNLDKISDRLNAFDRRFQFGRGIALVAIGIVFLINLFLSSLLTSAVAFPVNAILMAMAVAVLATIDPKYHKNLIGIDKILGGISYPIYLMHYQFAFLASKILPGLPAKGWILFFGSLPLIILGSLLVHLVVEKPIEAIRTSVKTSKKLS